jgi:hypothetical protein
VRGGIEGVERVALAVGGVLVAGGPVEEGLNRGLPGEVEGVGGIGVEGARADLVVRVAAASTS